MGMAPAVSLAIAKRAGANAVDLSETVASNGVKAERQPDPETASKCRSPAITARRPNEKANELIFHLGLATVSIVMLIGFAIGWREAGVTAIVIPTTIMLTMFASNHGLHDQPGQPVRADLLDRHPGR
jgi:multidrug efflux pump subunit AcrB